MSASDKVCFTIEGTLTQSWQEGGGSLGIDGEPVSLRIWEWFAQHEMPNIFDSYAPTPEDDPRRLLGRKVRVTIEIEPE